MNQTHIETDQIMIETKQIVTEKKDALEPIKQWLDSWLATLSPLFIVEKKKNARGEDLPEDKQHTDDEKEEIVKEKIDNYFCHDFCAILMKDHLFGQSLIQNQDKILNELKVEILAYVRDHKVPIKHDHSREYSEDNLKMTQKRLGIVSKQFQDSLNARTEELTESFITEFKKIKDDFSKLGYEHFMKSLTANLTHLIRKILKSLFLKAADKISAKDLETSQNLSFEIYLEALKNFKMEYQSNEIQKSSSEILGLLKNITKHENLKLQQKGSKNDELKDSKNQLRE